MNNDKLLQQALTKMLKHLNAKLDAGSISAQELSVLRNLLRDNNVQVLPEASPELIKLAQALPFDPNADE